MMWFNGARLNCEEIIECSLMRKHEANTTDEIN